MHASSLATLSSSCASDATSCSTSIHYASLLLYRFHVNCLAHTHTHSLSSLSFASHNSSLQFLTHTFHPIHTLSFHISLSYHTHTHTHTYIHIFQFLSLVLLDPDLPSLIFPLILIHSREGLVFDPSITVSNSSNRNSELFKFQQQKQ